MNGIPIKEASLAVARIDDFHFRLTGSNGLDPTTVVAGETVRFFDDDAQPPLEVQVAVDSATSDEALLHHEEQGHGPYHFTFAGVEDVDGEPYPQLIYSFTIGP